MQAHRIAATTLFAGALGLAIAGCSDSSSTDGGVADSGPLADAGPAADAGPLPDGGASFTMVYSSIIMPICTCHQTIGGEGQYPGNLPMPTQAMAYMSLVGSGNGQAAGGVSCVASQKKRVAPGDAANSLIIQKLKGTAGCGDQMPLGKSPLSTAQIDQISAWITAGAPNN